MEIRISYVGELIRSKEIYFAKKIGVGRWDHDYHAKTL